MIRTDLNPDHYAFRRTSGLPYGTFAAPRRRRYWPLIAALLILVAACSWGVHD